MPAAVISQPLVLPTRQEARLNGVRPVQSAQPVDPRKQIEAAITAFARTRIVVIVNGRPAADLDTPFTARNPSLPANDPHIMIHDQALGESARGRAPPAREQPG